MKECRPSAARNLDFYANDPKWLTVQTESTLWANIVQASWNKPESQILFADADVGLGEPMGGCVLSKGIKERDCEQIQMVFCSWPLPIPPPSLE